MTYERNVPCLDGTLEGHEYIEKDGKKVCKNCGRPYKFKRFDKMVYIDGKLIKDKKFIDFLHREKEYKRAEKRE